MHKKIKSIIEEKINQNINLEIPKDLSLGHFAFAVFKIAKEQKTNPIKLAEEFCQNFKGCSEFCEIEAVRGFVNFKLSSKFLIEQIDLALKKDIDFAKEEDKNQKILLEYVSANPTGPLHIGHARGAVFGDTLNRVGKYLGYDIVTEYYINDAGAQIELLGLSISLAAKEFLFNEEVEYPEKYYRGEYLVDIAKKAYEKFGKDIFYDEARFNELAQFGKDLVLEIIIKDLKNIGIEFDNFVSEKSLYKDWDKVRNILETNGYLYKKDGKIFIKSSEFGDDNDRVVVRDDGRPTYLAGDIIYHKFKFDRDFDRYINIWGADHHGYIKRVKAAIKFLGYDETKLEILLSQMVSLLKDGKPFKMSKRAGTVVLMSEVVEEIGSEAMRFIFLTKSADKHLEFELNDLKKQDSSNPIFYINYAHARINQLFQKAQKDIKYIKDLKIDNIPDEIKEIAFYSLLLNNVLNEAWNKREFQKITEYLYNLSSKIHKFYNEFKIVGSKSENEYLKVLAMAKLSIKTGLSLLGIKAKEKM